jgi:hypothetical protein
MNKTSKPRTRREFSRINQILNSGNAYKYVFIIFLFMYTGCQPRQTSEAGNDGKNVDTLLSIKDFNRLEIDGYVPTYRDEQRNVLAVNSILYEDMFGAAETEWEGNSGVYNVTIETMPEEDGESTYHLIINGEIKGEFTNPETDLAFGHAVHKWENIRINNGDTIRIASNTHSNGLIPENDGFAWARGRWSKLILEKSN